MKKHTLILLSFLMSIFMLSCAPVSRAQTKDIPIHARAAVLMDGSTQRILYGKNETERLPMASTTKIMTCLYTLEHGRLTDIVTISDKAASAPKVRLGAPAGSRFLLSDLLYALMLESDNDAAIAIAEHVSGSVEQFCIDMTNEARDYGCFRTSFQTPNGLDSDDHYTTCYDLALITCRALENRKFRSIIKEREYTIKDLKHKRCYSLNNKDRFLDLYPDSIGVKTGFTSKAGYCFVGAVEKKEHYLISVVLGSGWPPNRSWKWEDTKQLMNYGTKNYSLQKIVLNKEIPGTIAVNCGQKNNCPVKGHESIQMLLSPEDHVSIKTDIPDTITAPVYKNDRIGTVTVMINNTKYRQYPVVAARGIARTDFFFYLGILLQSL